MSEIRRWLWLHFTRDGRDELNATKRYWARIEESRNSPAVVEWHERTKACSPHPNRTLVAMTLGVPPRSIWRCADCGVSIREVARPT